jgi:hypothetical protein
MAIEKEPVKPVAVAEIVLSKAQRSRIAKELGLERDQLDAVPEKLEILRFDQKSIARRKPANLAAERLGFGKIPSGILVTV